MKIGVISDTHIANPSRGLPEQVHEAFEGVDMILHAGDILIEEVLIELGVIAPVYAVAGNNDGYDMLYKYGSRRILTIGGKRIGLTHGGGRGRAYVNAYAEFLDEGLDCIVFGHSHAPYNEIVDGILFFNPGSPTNRRMSPKYSVGILHIAEDIRGEIIYF